LDWFFDIGGPLIFGGLALLVIAVVITALLRAQSACLDAGYRDATVTWHLRAYCVKRVDQTDVVVPLAEVKH
jgi:hypothetical protein